MSEVECRKRILVVGVNWIGDVVFMTPFLRALRLAYRGSYIACLIHPRCKEVLETNKRIDEIIFYDENGVHKSLSGKFNLVRELRAKRFDAAFILHQSFTKALLTYLAGVKERIGYATKNRRLLLTKAIPEPSSPLHKVEYFLNIARICGFTPDKVGYEFFIDASSRADVANFLQREGLGAKDGYAVLCPGGNWDPKRWPRGSFAQLADETAKRFGLKIVLSGSEKDLGLVDEIKTLMKTKPIIACGKLDLKQLAALFAGARFVVANDSGPMHLAVASGARVVAIFGPTSPRLTGPYGDGLYTVVQKDIECEIPCYNKSCNDYKCMSQVAVSDVVGAIDGILKR